MPEVAVRPPPSLDRRLALEDAIRMQFEPERMRLWQQGNFQAVHELENRRDNLIEPIRLAALAPGEGRHLSWKTRMQYHQEWRREVPSFSAQYETYPDLMESIERMERNPTANQHILAILWQGLLSGAV